MAQNDQPNTNPITSLLRRLFGGTPYAPAEAQTPAVPVPVPEIVITDENRADLLQLAANAPLAYGYWAQVKRLYKAAEKAQDTALLGALISRLDTVVFAEKPEPLSTSFQEANAGPVVRVQVVGTTAYVLTQGRSPGLSIVDVSDPVLPRLLGQWRVREPMDVVVADNRAYVLEANPSYGQPGALHVLDVSQPDNPLALGKVALMSPFRVTLMGKYALVLTNDYRTAGLYIFDVTNPKNILTIGTIKVEAPGDIALWNTTAYILRNVNSYGAQKILTLDLSNPVKPTTTATLNTPNANALALSHNCLYVTASSYSYYRNRANPGLYVYKLDTPLSGQRPHNGYVEIENAHKVLVQGRYAYIGLTTNYGPHGGLQIVDIADPMQPKLAGKLQGGTVSQISVDANHPDTLLLSMEVERYRPFHLAVANVSHPDKPFIFGTLPSNQTFGYMKRRARRVLRTLAEQDPTQYVTLATQILIATGKGRDTVDARVQWVTMDILFGGSKRYEQAGHGRGAYLKRGSKFTLRTREEAYPYLWDRHPLLVESLYTQAELPWQTHETACKMLRGMKRPLPAMPDATLLRFLQSPSSLLVVVATRALAAQLGTNYQTAPDLVAETFYKGSGQSRRAVRDYIARQTNLGSKWSSAFANRLYKLASAEASGVELSRRQGIAFAYLVAAFPGVLSRQVAPDLAAQLYATRRPELNAWTLATLRETSVTQISAWLQALAPLADDLRIAAVAALAENLRNKPFAYAMMQSLVNDPSEWVRAITWDLIAVSQTPAADLAKLWDDLLAATAETDALRTATASASAIALFNRLDLDGDKLQSLLESRPFLVGLLPESALQNIVRVLPVASILGLVRAANQAQWAGLRTVIADGITQANAVPAFWKAAWQQIGATGDAIFVTRLLDDEVMSATFLQVAPADSDDYLNTTNPVFGPLLGRWARVHETLFEADSTPLLQIATHTLPDIRAFGLERVRQVGMGLPFALRLLESELPASVEAGKAFFEAVPAGTPREIEALTALCDSPKETVRKWGRQVLEARWSHLPQEELFDRLSENTDPLMEAFLAGKMLKTKTSFTLAPTFDRQVLRSRDKGRKAKELVKQRLNTETSHDVPMLLEVARSRSQRDAEWALGQLARLALEGIEIEGLVIS